MKPLASALDYLQGEATLYLGHLLPTIHFLKQYLEETKEEAVTCKPLAEAALQGVKKRFDAYFECKEMLIASTYLPEFKVSSHFQKSCYHG